MIIIDGLRLSILATASHQTNRMQNKAMRLTELFCLILSRLLHVLCSWERISLSDIQKKFSHSRPRRIDVIGSCDCSQAIALSANTLNIGH